MVEFGCDFGVLLQNYDDLGSLLGHAEAAKRYEDLVNKSPSWVWALVASEMTAERYNAFRLAVDQLETSEQALLDWIEASEFRPLAREVMQRKLSELQLNIEEKLKHLDLKQRRVLSELTERLSYVYTKVLK